MQYSEMSESIKNIASAQIKVQKEIEDIGKDAKGYGYKYTSYDTLVKYLRPLLTKHGISFIQMPIGSKEEVGLETLYMHTSGEWIKSAIKSPIVDSRQMNTYQSIGSAITYFRRYSLSAFVGIASDEDNDTQLIKKSTVTVKQTTDLDKLVKEMYKVGSLDANAKARYDINKSEGHFDNKDNWQKSWDSLNIVHNKWLENQEKEKKESK